MNGTSLQNFESRLCTIMWRSWNRSNRIANYLQLLTTYYTLDEPVNFTTTYPIFNSWSVDAAELNKSSFIRNDSSDEQGKNQ